MSECSVVSGTDSFEAAFFSVVHAFVAAMGCHAHMLG